MSENWKSYLCNVNGKLASIALDLEAGKQSSSGNKPWLLWVWVYLQWARPDGLSDRKEFETISAIEEALTAQILATCEGVNVGRITTDGRREFYFYGAPKKSLFDLSRLSFKAAVSKAMSGFKGYRFDCGCKKDVEWTQYFNVLFPSDEELEKIKNHDVLDVLEENGDVPAAVRTVNHWIYFSNAADREWYASKVRELGYTTLEHMVEQKANPGNRTYALVANRQKKVTPDSIDAAVLALVRLAKTDQR